MRLIDADAFIAAARRVETNLSYADDCADFVDKMPTVDPVKHGEWIFEPGRTPYCSECHEYSEDGDKGGEFCPWCGAKMYGYKNNEVPTEFMVRTLDGKEITGDTRNKLYEAMNSSIDKFLESESEDGGEENE